MIIKKSALLLIGLCILSTAFDGCEIHQPAAPVWNTELSLPFASKNYTIFDIIKHSNNIGSDSANNNLVFLYGESNYRRSFGEDIKFDGIKTTQIEAPSTLLLDTSITVDDSTFVRRIDFLNGTLTFDFFNLSGKDYLVNAKLKNLFNVSDDDTVRIVSNVSPGEEKSVVFNLENYYVKNETEDNRLKISLAFQSETPVPVNFNYTLSEYSVKRIEGKLKPLSTGQTSDIVTDPFGSDVPEGSVNFSSVTPNRNFLILKKYSDIYRVDFSNISIIGENKNGKQVRLKYLRNGRPGDPMDSVFSLTLPMNLDSLAFPINEDNSNILEFINNIPKKITAERNDILNKSYEEGAVNYTDSLTLKFQIQMPLDFSVNEPVLFTDTADVGISDEDQRNLLDDVLKMSFVFSVNNGFPLKSVAKLLVLDSSFAPIMSVTKIAGNLPDSTVIINAAPVGQDGFANSTVPTLFRAELDSAQIQQLKHMGKIIFEYRLYTDPGQIPPPLNSVKIKGSDLIKAFTFGKFDYVINRKD